jgi:hypothetical protein
MEKATPHRKKQFIPNAFKFLLAVGSMAGTLGIWSLLANKDLQQVNAQNNAALANINQSPLPTVAPLVNVNISSSGITLSQPAATLPLRDVTPPPTTNINNSNSGQTNPYIFSAPVTTTRSSRP